MLHHSTYVILMICCVCREGAMSNALCFSFYSALSDRASLVTTFRSYFIPIQIFLGSAIHHQSGSNLFAFPVFPPDKRRMERFACRVKRSQWYEDLFRFTVCSTLIAMQCHYRSDDTVNLLFRCGGFVCALLRERNVWQTVRSFCRIYCSLKSTL